ncbi:MAG: ATP-binding protein [FCB group bacterium]|jgi:signal transduction histidine kinase|nr:ATP-binding protein [FCB group bacterium]
MKSQFTFGLRQKLLLGFGGLVALLLAVGLYSIVQVSTLGDAIDVILRENYKSVIAAQEMKESLERIDSGVLFVLLGNAETGNRFIDSYSERFEKALAVELSNITLPGERETAQRIRDRFRQYHALLATVRDSARPSEERRAVYFAHLMPLFQEIKHDAEAILQMNQRYMEEANDAARRQAASARRHMYLWLLAGVAVAVVFIVFAGRWILRPLARLASSVEEIRRGNLDLVVASNSRDEIGRLSESFNAMAESLREYRRSEQAKMVRTQRATQEAFKSLPDAVAVVDPDGTVEVATEPAQAVFGLRPGAILRDIGVAWMSRLHEEALRTLRPAESTDGNAVVQQFVGGEERFYRPRALPILNREGEATGAVLVMADVTQLRQSDELKRGLISTVSHQLKTPLTSIRMAVHLLLDEKVGPLTPKQNELIVAARDDSERLFHMVEDLLDLGRIQSGRVQMECEPVPPQALLAQAVEKYRAAAQNVGVELESDAPADLPEVAVDMTRIQHVFDNLLSNALKYTAPGGRVTLRARADGGRIRFEVSDTGRGIPAEYLDRVFEQFFRVPGEDREPGAGLGLAIVKEIIEAHGGAVDVESREGEGSTFGFTLPRAAMENHAT